jgi:hypothetical protein
MATRAEIEAMMAQQLGTAPRKRTRAEIEAEMAEKLGTAVQVNRPPSVRDYMASAQGLAESEKALKAVEAENNFGQNMLAGAGKVVSDLGSGGQQIAARVMGDDEKLAQLQADEAEERRLVEPLTSSAGGITGNILTNAALFAVPGAQAGKAATAGTTALKMSPRAAQLLGAMIGEGAIGGLGGLLTPTTADESLSGNVGASAALGAVMPGVGAVLKSKPVQAAADTVLDYTPLVAGARRRARNVAGEAAYGAEKAAFDKAKDTAIRNAKLSYEADKKAFTEQKKAFTQANRYATALRDEGQEMKSKFITSEAQREIAEAAGFRKYPKDKLEFEEEIRNVGSQYGKLIEPIRMDLPDMSDLLEQEGNAVSGLYKKLVRNAEKNAPAVAKSEPNLAGYPGIGAAKTQKLLGTIEGETYKAVRADAVEALGDAQGDARIQLRDFISRLDNQFEAAIPPDQYAEVIGKRAQYATASTMRNAKWNPGEGADIEAVLGRLDSREIADGLRTKLYGRVGALKESADRPALDLPEVDVDKPRAPLARDVDVGMDAPEKFTAEASDPIRLAAINMGLGGGLSAVMGGAPAAMTMASLPLLAAGIKQATNPRVAKTVNALRRGATIGYGTVLAPEQED